eukprot:gene1991-33412_t
MPEEVPAFEDFVPRDSHVDIRSTWAESQNDISTTGMMTDPLDMVDATIQTTKRAGVAVQTDPEGAQQTEKKDFSGLADFVSKVESVVSTELQKASEEADQFDPFVRVGAEKKNESAILVHELTAFAELAVNFESNDVSKRNRLVVTSLSWSATGQSIAASYGRYDIVGWCTDRGALVTWNLGRETVNPSKPDVNIEVDNCLMSCAYHPVHPALIAGGTFNGDLYVWDLSQEGDFQKAKSDAVSDLRHREPISDIVWLYSMTEYQKYGTKSQAYRLVTLGADGRVMIWQWHKLEQPVYGYQLLWPSPGSDHKILWGGTCMSFQVNAARQGGEGGTFIVGTEGGKIFKCYCDINDVSLKEFAKTAVLNDAKLAQELRCPIKETDYTPHAGAVYGVDCSPFQQDLFLTSGADGNLRLYHTLKQQTLLIMSPSSTHLYGTKWSPFRPLVFAANGGDGRVYFYDLLRAKDNIIRPVLSIDTSMGGGGSGNPVYAAAFNKKQTDMFATGDALGIQIWKLPASLSTASKGEEGAIRRMAAADDVSEWLRMQRSVHGR